MPRAENEKQFKQNYYEFLVSLRNLNVQNCYYTSLWPGFVPKGLANKRLKKLTIFSIMNLTF